MGDKFDVGSFAAARAGSGEFKEGLRELRVFGIRRDIHEIGLIGHVIKEVFRNLILAFMDSLVDRDHLQCLLALSSGASVHADFAARAVGNGDDDRIFQAFKAFPDRNQIFRAFRCFADFLFGGKEGSDDSMGADKAALIALNAVFFDPFRNEGSDIALFIRSRPVVHGSVFITVKGRNGKVITFDGIDRMSDSLNEFRQSFRKLLLFGFETRPCGIDGHFPDAFAPAVDGSVVKFYNRLSFFNV